MSNCLFERSCLFVQWKNPTDASRFVIDGKACEYSGTKEQDKIMNIFADIPKYRQICSNKGRNDLSPSFRCSSKKTKSSRKLYFVEGNFEETDCSGRKLVYIFATYENDPEKIVEILKDSASLLGVTPHVEDLEEIKKNKFNKQSKKIVLCVTIATIILLLSYMLLNPLSKQ